MAGVLPGVEAARRRRLQKTNNQIDNNYEQFASRRSSFCLYATTHDHFSNSNTRMKKYPSIRHESRIMLCDESRLDAPAREAKKRLDERLQPPPHSSISKNNRYGKRVDTTLWNGFAVLQKLVPMKLGVKTRFLGRNSLEACLGQHNACKD